MTQTTNDSHDISIKNSIHLHRPIIVLGSGILTFFYVIVGIFAATHWLTFVALTQWITYGTFTFFGLLAVLFLYVTFTNHQARLQRQRTETDTLRYLPHIPDNVIVQHKSAPYACTPIIEEQIRYNIRVNELQRQNSVQNALQSPTAIAQPDPILSACLEKLPRNALQFVYGVCVETGELLHSSLPAAIHMQLVGSTGQGKSKQAQSILTQLAYANDQEHLRFAFVDCEGETTQPFQQLPHVRHLAQDELGAASTLRTLVKELERRDRMSKQQLAAQPVFLIFVEEFLSLYKTMRTNREQALEDYTQLALRGRKRGIFLFSIGQSAYTQRDIRDAQLQFLSNMAFACKPQAARAAGFGNNELLKRLYQEKRPGQFLLEQRQGDYLVLAPYVEEREIEALLGGSVSLPDSTITDAEEVAEVAQEAAGSTFDTSVDLSTIQALRTIGKRLKNGETPSEIVKSYGLPYGRATQELSAAIRMVQEEEV